MKEKKLQVFVSSTFTDLIEERQAAVEAILSSGNIPAGMELFSAGDQSQMTIIKRWIDESDVYMLILGARYGSIESTTGKSYTQLEYEYAVSKEKPFFAVVLSDEYNDEKFKERGMKVIDTEYGKELKSFKELVISKMVEICNDTKDIKLAVHKTLSNFEYEKKLVGWIRGDNAINTSLLAEEIARLTKENHELTKNLSKQETLYNGLTYAELKNQLINYKIENIEGLEEITNLFEYLKVNGKEFSISSPQHLYDELAELTNLKILNSNKKEIELGFDTHDCHLSDDGHKFYLRSLLDNE